MGANLRHADVSDYAIVMCFIVGFVTAYLHDTLFTVRESKLKTRPKIDRYYADFFYIVLWVLS